MEYVLAARAPELSRSWASLAQRPGLDRTAATCPTSPQGIPGIPEDRLSSADRYVGVGFAPTVRRSIHRSDTAATPPSDPATRTYGASARARNASGGRPDAASSSSHDGSSTGAPGRREATQAGSALSDTGATRTKHSRRPPDGGTRLRRKTSSQCSTLPMSPSRCEPGSARWVPCRASATPIPDPGSLHVTCWFTS